MTILTSAAMPRQASGVPLSFDPERIYTVAEVCRLLRKGKDAVYGLLDRGELVGVRTGQAGWRIAGAALAAYMKVPTTTSEPAPTPPGSGEAVADCLAAVRWLLAEQRRQLRRQRREATDQDEREELLVLINHAEDHAETLITHLRRLQATRQEGL